jgi:hypothetical protein
MEEIDHTFLFDRGDPDSGIMEMLALKDDMTVAALKSGFEEMAAIPPLPPRANGEIRPRHPSIVTITKTTKNGMDIFTIEHGEETIAKVLFSIANPENLYFYVKTTADNWIYIKNAPGYPEVLEAALAGGRRKRRSTKRAKRRSHKNRK